MNGYEDILHLQRPESTRPRMHRQERAKQFLPFAALSGLTKTVHERDRVLEMPIMQTEYSQQLLDEKLRCLRKGNIVTVIYFVPEKQADGQLLGAYVTVTGAVAKLDVHGRVLQLENGTIPLEAIAQLRGEGSAPVDT